MRRLEGFTVPVLLIAVPLAAASLLLPFAPAFDAWAWLVWGREIGSLELDTSAGASFKPLTVAVATLLAPAGEGAPELWLLIARVGWLVAIALTGRLAWRLARAAGCGERSSMVAAVAGAVSLLLLRDAFTPWLRQAASGLSEPLLVATVLGAIEAHLSGRSRLAFWLLVAASLLRPEAWPFLAGYAFHLWRRQEGRLWELGAGLAAIPLLWLLPDLIGSGSPLTGAERARADEEGPVTTGLEAIWRTFNLAPAALVIATIAWLGVGRPPRQARVLAALAAGWGTVVVAMALVGYAGLPRFSAPVGALVSAIGVAAIVALASRRAWRPVLAAMLALGLLVQAGTRVALLPGDYAEANRLSGELEASRTLLREVGVPQVRACAPLSTSDPLTRSALAWELEVPVGRVELATGAPPEAGLAVVAPEAKPAARPAGPTALASVAGWRAYAIGCPSAAATDSAAGSGDGR